MKRSVRRWCVVLITAGILGSGTGRAEEPNETRAVELKKMSLEQLMQIQVSTLSRVDERSDLAPGSVYVFTREDIQKRGYRSLGELLQVVPGFTVFHRDLQFVAGVRGLNASDNEKISLLINGQNLNGASEPDFLNGPINLDNVDRVEVVVGPSSLFQPANTLAATVNVITKDVPGGEVLAATGNARPYSTTLMLGKQWAPDESVSFSFTTEAKDGFHAWLDNAKTGQPDLQNNKTGQLETPSIFSVLKGQLGEWSAQAVAYRMQSPELNIDSLNPTNNGQSVDQFYSVFLKNEHPWTGDLTSVLRMDGTYKQKSRLEDGSATNDDGIAIVVSAMDFTADLSLRYIGFTGHSIQAGIQGGYEHNFDTYAIVSYPGYSVVPKTPLVTADAQSVGFYADDEYQVNNWLKLVGGVRVDYNTELLRDAWFPGARVAIIVAPAPNWVSKLTYNRAVRMPTSVESPLDQTWGQGKASAPPFAITSGNADSPEILTTYEWENIVYLGPVRLGTTLYHQELEDFIGWYDPWTNVGNFRGNGVEFTAQVKLESCLTLWANGSWNDSTLHVFHTGLAAATAVEPVNQQGRIIGAPEYIANAGVDYEIIKNLTLSPAVRYFTEQAASVSQGNLTTIRNRVYCDATLQWRGWTAIKGTEMDVRLSGYNLADNRAPVAAQWRPILYNPQGITAVLAVDVRF